MAIIGAEVNIRSAAEAHHIESVLTRTIAGGPFVVTSIEPGTSDRRRCVFGLKRSGLTVGYRSVIQLQHRISEDFDIVSVESHDHLNHI